MYVSLLPQKKEEMYLKFKSACPVTELGKLK